VRRRVAFVLIAAIVAVVIVAVVRHQAAGGPIPIPPNLPAAPRTSRPLGAALDADHARHDPAYLRDYLTTFTSLTPENAMKWAVVEPSEGHFDFGDADALVDFAQKTGRRVRGHTLVWDEQLPAWVTGRAWTAEALRSALVDHIKTVVGHFRGRVTSWDVVNEPFRDGSFKPDVFARVLGPSYITTALQAAHDADPAAKLFINELAAERPGPKRDALLGLAASLRAAGVPLDGIGLQDHTTLAGAPTRADLEDTMHRIAALGLDAELTEVDVAIPPSTPTTPAVLGQQAAVLGDAARACADVPRCTGMTVWGVDDHWSWLGAARRPLLFDADAKAKPALDAVRGALGP
jgi:endo-1,4-beta-xylanase